ncbi:efflux RND transporter permease subunit [Agromyces protaetiae]|uniref:Efflux RND transporter permease subunit n=1 Tax=Agromyces protaetiae TaxID=2509455 RepID=A0A4P6F8B9_9MICO|nr:efflux RND transporter permease subunit [Agromyces protaetiae]QAY72072.1 efflux RND transporter permease subunit [Agromyces protaetiae]
MFRLARFSLANRALVALVTLVITGFGLFSMTQLKQELIPSIEFPQSQIVTVVPGASPEVIDEQIGLPLSKALEAIPEVESVVATSSSSVSTISVAYAYGTDAKEFQASVQDAIDGLEGVLPSDASPQVLAGSSSALPIMFLTASSADRTPAELTADLRDVVVPKLEGIEGVRAATVSGAQTERVVITPDLQELGALGISPTAISDALKANGMTLPMGSIAEDGSLRPVQGGSAIVSLDDLRALPLASTTQPGTVAELGDVASVDVVAETPTSITRTNGDEALSVMVTATQDADIVAVSHAVNTALDDLRDELSDVDLTVMFDQAPFIEESIQHLAIEGLLGLVFAVVVILIFLRSVRPTLVTAISIPLSVLVTFIGLNLGGHSLNMLTLGALTIAIGRVVDDSIVVIENIKRHLSYGERKQHAILAGVREVAGAITSSTLTTVAVFLPIAVVGGLVGELFAPFALTVTIAMLSSLLVSLTIVPVLSYWFLKQPGGAGDTAADVSADADAKVAAVRAEAEAKERKSWLQRVYTPVLRGTQKHPVITLVASVLLLVVTLGSASFLKVDFLGSTGQNSLTVTQEFPAGTDLDTISSGASEVEDALLAVDGVEDVMLTAGSGGGAMAMLGGGSTSATFIVNTDKGADQVALKQDVRDALDAIDGAGEIALADASAAGGFGGTVDVQVSARGEDELATAASAVYDALADTPKAAAVASNLAPAQPIVQVTVDRAEALRQGLTEMQVLGIAANALSPQSVGKITLDGEELSIFVNTTTPPATVEELRDVLLPTAAGFAPLTSVASVEEVTVPTSITRDGGDLTATISITPDEGELGAVTASVTESLADLDLPEGATAEIGGLAATQAESFGQLGLAMLVAIALVFMLLVATFRSLVQPLILLVSIPFAATGAIGLLLATGTPLGISALIGMLMLIGIVVTNAIVLIDLVNQYREQGQSVADAVFNGARQRLRPILMTALATIFALTPMALGVTGSSGFISQDLAIVVIGGLVSSTLLTLILVPVLYRLIEGRRERRAAKRAARAGEAGVAAAAASPETAPDDTPVPAV